MNTWKIDSLFLNLEIRARQLLVARDLERWVRDRDILIAEAARVGALRGTPEYSLVRHEALKKARRELRALGIPQLFRFRDAAEAYRHDTMDPEEREELLAELSPEEAFPPLQPIAELEGEWDAILSREDGPACDPEDREPRQHLIDHERLIDLDPEGLGPLLQVPLAPIWRDARDREEGVAPEQAAAVRAALQVFDNPHVLAFLRTLSARMKALREPSPGKIVYIDQTPVLLNGECAVMKALLEIRRLAAEVAPYNPQGVGVLAARVDEVLDGAEYRDAMRAAWLPNNGHLNSPWPGEEAFPEDEAVPHWWTWYAQEAEWEEMEHGSPRPGLILSDLSYTQDCLLRDLEEDPGDPENRARARFLILELRGPSVTNLFRRAQALFPQKLGDRQGYLDEGGERALMYVLGMRADASKLYAATGDPGILEAITTLDDTLDHYPQALQAIRPEQWATASEWTAPTRDHWWGVRLAGEDALAAAVTEGTS